MMRCFLPLLVVGSALSVAGCASCPIGIDDRCPSSAEKKGPKTLFAWAICKEKESDETKKGDEETDKSGNGESAGNKAEDKKSPKATGEGDRNDSQTEPPARKPDGKDRELPTKNASLTNGKKSQDGKDGEAQPEVDEIQTDRPDFTEASTTVGKGRIQLETGYTFTRDRANGARLSAHSYPDALLRIGMFAEWFEIRLGQTFADERTVMMDGSVASSSGAADLYLGVKLALTEQQKSLPEMALILQMTVPSGAKDFSAGEALPGINWLYGWDVVEDCLSVAGSTQANRSRGLLLLPVFSSEGQLLAPIEGKHSYLELAQSVTVGYTLTKKLTAYTEWFAFFPHSALDPDVGPEYYLNGGFAYKFTPNTQFDIRAGFGLNKHADDFFAGPGFSFRY